MFRRIALGLFFVVAALVTVLEVAGPYAWAIPLMPIPVLALAARLAATIPLRRSRLPVAALVCGALGDLALPLRGPLHSMVPFFAGMGLFLAGHVLYLAQFVRERRFQVDRLVHAAVVLAFAVTGAALLLPRLGGLGGPVALYAAVLTAMAVAAAFRRSDGLLVYLGAFLFVVSDFALGARLALPRLPHATDAFILVTYFAAQLLIAEGWAEDALVERAAAARAGDRR